MTRSEQPQPTKGATAVWAESHLQKLRMIVSAHVDDLKGAAKTAVAMDLLKHLEQNFGPCKSEWQSFMHVGIQHEQRDGEVYRGPGLGLDLDLCRRLGWLLIHDPILCRLLGWLLSDETD